MDFLNMRLHALRQKNESTPFLKEGIDDILADIEIYLLKVASADSISKKDLRGITRGYMYLYLFDDFSKTDLESALGEPYTINIFGTFMSTDEWKFYLAQSLSPDQLRSMDDAQARTWIDEKTGSSSGRLFSNAGIEGKKVFTRKGRDTFVELLESMSFEVTEKYSVTDQKMPDEMKDFTTEQWKFYYASVINPMELLTASDSFLFRWRDEKTAGTLMMAQERCGGKKVLFFTYKSLLPFMNSLFPHDTVIATLCGKYYRAKLNMSKNDEGHTLGKIKLSSKFTSFTQVDWIEYFKPKFSAEELLIMNGEIALSWKDSETKIGLCAVYKLVVGKNGKPIYNRKARLELGVTLYPDNEEILSAFKFASYTQTEWIEYFKQKLSEKELLAMSQEGAIKWKDSETKIGLSLAYGLVVGKSGEPLMNRKARLELGVTLYPNNEEIRSAFEFASYTQTEWIEYFKQKLSAEELFAMNRHKAGCWKDAETKKGLTAVFTLIGGKEGRPLDSSKARLEMALILHPELYKK